MWPAERHLDESALSATYAVIGLGVTGESCARYLHGRGAQVVVFDTRAEPPRAPALHAACPTIEVVTGTLDAKRLKRFASVVVSPGLALTEPALAAVARAGVPLYGDIELFARAAAAPIIAITGTNGKSTVTTLVGRMLEAAGYRVAVGGNLGTPALDLLGPQAPDCYILELSSFQLELVESLAPRVACVLNITPDHLDRYASFADYRAAKARILRRAEQVVLNADDAHTATLSASGRRHEFSLDGARSAQYRLGERGGSPWLFGPRGALIEAGALRIAGRHNVANALAALAICHAFGCEDARLQDALASFSGLEHRAEFVAVHDGVTYINDSKATNSGAACATIRGLCHARGGVLIAGGEAKESDFEEFARTVAAHLHTVVLIGRATQLFEQVLADRVRTLRARDMQDAVVRAAAAAKRDDLVLLSPACASFDMFANYAARGLAFRAAVAALGRT